jgi:hypothetical protein
MGWLALVLALASAGLVAAPGVALYFAMGLAMFAVAAGYVGHRRREAPAGMRLAGGGAMTLGAIAFVLASTRYALTMAALSKLGAMFGG